MTFDSLILVTALLTGIVLGLFYFGLLWMTVRRIPESRNPALLVIASLVGRLAVVIPAFYFVMNGRWEPIAVCMVGFLIVRQILVARIRPQTAVRPVSDSR